MRKGRRVEEGGQERKRRRRSREERSKEKGMFWMGSDRETSGLCSSDRPGASEGRQEREGSRNWDWRGRSSGPVPSGPVVLTQPLHTSLFGPKHQCGPVPPPPLLLAWLRASKGSPLSSNSLSQAPLPLSSNLGLIPSASAD